MTQLWPGGSWAGTASFADRLRAEWRTQSLRTGWSLPGDWWTPAVEAVVQAIHDTGQAASTRTGLSKAGGGLGQACVRLGQARGRAGVGIGETIADLGALFAVLCDQDPPLDLVRGVAEGWVDAGWPDPASLSCTDPLTGLVTVPYLRSRLAELYRAAGAAGSATVGETHRLVVVDLPDGSAPWRRLTRTMAAAQVLKDVFRTGETLALVSGTRTAALVPAHPHLEFRLRSLRNLLRHTDPVEEHPAGGQVHVRTERLPGTLREALALLDTLAG